MLHIVAAELVGALSGLLSGDIGGVYRSLSQPPLSPPGWVFPVVWIALFACMGAASFLVTRAVAPDRLKNSALVFYGLQLAVNFLWPIVFFRFGLFWVAALVIALLLVLLAATIGKMRRVRPAAAWWMAPYFLWVLFATYLNLGVAVLN